MTDEKERIEKFRKLIPCIGIGVGGILFFSEDDFIHNGYMSDLHQDPDLPYLLEKMDIILKNININPELVDKDVEKDLWKLT